jgi:hypothetical protein
VPGGNDKLASPDPAVPVTPDPTLTIGLARASAAPEPAMGANGTDVPWLRRGVESLPALETGSTGSAQSDEEAFARAAGDGGAGSGKPACTSAQLRRFIKSRVYVPMHELRRRFAINGNEDDMTAIPVSEGCVFVGLPPQEGRMLGELLRQGEVGYELSLDPASPVVVGVFPMRPVPRP